MAKKFFIEITDPEKNQTHISEFNQSKTFNSIEACQTFLDDNFIVYNKNNLVINHWKIEQKSDTDTNTDQNSYLGISGRQAVELQKGINIYLPYENDDQNLVSTSNWIIRTGSGPDISDNLKNRCIVLKNNKALVNWTDGVAHDLRPEAVLRLYALRGQYPVLENLENNNDVCNLDNLQYIWKDQVEFTEHRFFIEGKKGVEMSETKPYDNSDWIVKPLVEWEEFKTTYEIYEVSDKDRAKNITIPSVINGKPVKTIQREGFKNCVNLKTVIIPKSIASIGYEAFSGCSQLKHVVIPNSVTSIGWGAFKGCLTLTNIVIPDSVTSIGVWMFCGCVKLKNVVISNSVTSIEDGTFVGCVALTNVVIPDSVTSIGNGVFGSCKRLSKIVIPNSVTSIGKRAFRGCVALTNVIIPDSVTSIGYKAFRDCKSLDNVVIPDSVTSIGHKAFEGCVKLTNIVIPCSVTSIENIAFGDCTELKKITVNAITPPSIVRNVFDNNAQDRKIFVPKKSLDDYKQKWSDYKDDIFPIE